MGWYSRSYSYWSTSVRRDPKREMARLVKQGRELSPVALDSQTIARSFWGVAWCKHLETHCDDSNRLPRGRSYVRSGSVIDLQIQPGMVKALVVGSSLYEVEIGIEALSPANWASIRDTCAGQVGSLVDLLMGNLSSTVMEIVTRQPGGLFPKRSEMHLSCSCPDGARMCKHIAATLFGVGARLDTKPELLFKLRKVDHLELIGRTEVASGLLRGDKAVRTIDANDLESVFGIELDTAVAPAPVPPAPVPVSSTRVTRKPNAALRASVEEPVYDEEPYYTLVKKSVVKKATAKKITSVRTSATAKATIPAKRPAAKATPVSAKTKRAAKVQPTKQRLHGRSDRSTPKTDFKPGPDQVVGRRKTVKKNARRAQVQNVNAKSVTTRKARSDAKAGTAAKAKPVSKPVRRRIKSAT